MSLQWELVVGFLYFEIILVFVLLLPFLSPQTWQKLFKSNLVKRLSAGATYYFSFVIIVLVFLFADSIRQFTKHQKHVDRHDHGAVHAAEHEMMVTFRAQRNFYITGFALFLWFVIKRLMTLLSLCAHHMAESAAAQKQAKGASQYAEMLMAEGEKTKNHSSSKDSVSAEEVQELEKYKKELEKTNEEMELLRQKYQVAKDDFDNINTEYQKLLKRSSTDEKAKSK